MEVSMSPLLGFIRKWQDKLSSAVLLFVCYMQGWGQFKSELFELELNWN